MFHGSYTKNDVIFLMRIIDLEETPIEKKEQYIRSQKHHYSEMISPEYRPDKKYLELFHEAMELNLDRVTENLLALADYYSKLENPIIVSLARAGTPIGVILTRMLNHFYGLEIPHYSISIIKDRGIDENALLHIINNHPEANITFLDGWVSKGSIANELSRSINNFNAKYGVKLNDHLHVISDISGNAYLSVTNDDYLIPSAILNSVISGLISRSIYTAEMELESDFHGCKYYEELSDIDLSLWYVEKIISRAKELKKNNDPTLQIGGNSKLKQEIKSFMDNFTAENNISNLDFLKPGIGEATRALLRRVPNYVLIQDLSHKDINHILHLCEQRKVEVKVQPHLPFKVMAVL
jgi:hypothetical protein